MGKFLFGFVAAIIVVLLGSFFYVQMGYVNLRADIPVNPIEKAVAMPAFDASLDRRAPVVKDPVQPTEDNLIAGMKLYQTDCASCHGDTAHISAVLASSLYPRPPQFMKHAPDMPDYKNFYVILHGVRWTGMPAWINVLPEQQIWQLTTFLSHMGKLPPNVENLWRSPSAVTVPAK